MSCTFEATPSESTTEPEKQSQQLAEAWLDAFSTNDHENLHEVMSPDAVIYGLGGVDAMTLDEMFTKMDESAQAKNHSPYVDKRWLPISENDALFGGDGVLFWGTSVLNLKNGITIKLPVHMVTVVNDGKIIAMHFYYDVFKILRESGYKVVAPSKRRAATGRLQPIAW